MASGAVKLKTPIPSLKQVGKELGLNSARQKRLISIVRRDAKDDSFVSTTAEGKTVAQKRAKN